VKYHAEADMTTEKLSRLWLLATFFLIIIIVISGLVIWIKREKGQLITISSPVITNFRGDINIDGAVNNPGIYPLKDTDSLSTLIEASGGTDSNADMSTVHLYIPSINENSQPQKIDINRAEAWLLQALPEIGEARAQAIINHRQQYGPFHNIEEITQVQGISATIFERIKDLITLAE
jgi:competence protein ComEA